MITQIETPYAMALPDTSVRNKLLTICRDRSAMISSATITVTLVLFIGGLASIISPNPVFIICGISALSWSLVLSWYLSHECAHKLVFAKKSHNRLLGEILFGINGLSYFPFSDYCSEHMRHHIEKVDLIGVDLRKRMNASPHLVKTLLLALEYAYIPIVFFYVKYFYVYQILKSGSQTEKTRACGSAFFYLAFVLSVAALNPLSLCWLFIAVSIRIHLIRPIDAFQHSYKEVDVAAKNITKKSRDYEQHNTYSFPVAR